MKKQQSNFKCILLTDIDSTVSATVVALNEKKPSTIEYNQLPAKYRRISISQTEMEFINVRFNHFFDHNEFYKMRYLIINLIFYLDFYREEALYKDNQLIK